MIKEYIQFAKEEKILLEIESVKGKKFDIFVLDYNEDKVFYKFANSGQDGQIKFENIIRCRCKDDEYEKIFCYKQIDNEYKQTDVRNIVDNLSKYYFEILNLLQSKEREGTLQYNYFNSKKSVYKLIFDELHKDKDNLLFSYFTGKLLETNKNEFNQNNSKKEHSLESILLLQQSNLSQKKAIEVALNNKISIIEGPPGTGKTTTILSIIANQVNKNKKVVVVSKNNSAIDNVAEELRNMPFPELFIRFGNQKIMKDLGIGIKDKLKIYEKEIIGIPTIALEGEKERLNQLFQELNEMEEHLNQLISDKNKLSELENQHRHLMKRREAYQLSDEFINKFKRKKWDVNKTKRKIEYLSDILVQMSDGKRINFFKRIMLYLTLNVSFENLESQGIAMQISLEEKYLDNVIHIMKKRLENDNLEQLQEKVRNSYVEKYIEISRKILLSTLKKNYNEKQFENIFQRIENENDEDNIMARCRNDIIDIYPVILTTVDAFLSNYYSYFKTGKKIDFIIIDEASQCDILSALPLLYLAKQIVVVGDCKQLNAIINLSKDTINTKVEESYDYTKESFLSTISKAMNPPSNMLLEHYRCDYMIINYCNKYFYDNQLIIYKNAKNGAMRLIDNDKGKYIDVENKSFVNKREIVTIDLAIQSDIHGKFVITPFSKQAQILKKKYSDSQCGTIHTFQGKGEKEVWFSTVLNHTPVSINHVQGKNNLFKKELINVAVSRAKERFIMVTDVTFFKQYSTNMKSLIEYMEVYGENIPDKTVCIFDYLYKQMKSYTVIDNCDNIFEKTVKNYIDEFIQLRPEYQLVVKLPLASVVTDRNFLESNPDIKRFILNNAHLDFTIYDRRIRKPIVAIELDGKYHKMEE
ncbi:AAA family ATPase [Clostridium botulinum]